MAMTTVIGLFGHLPDADRAIHELNARGLSDTEISVLARQEALYDDWSGTYSPVTTRAAAAVGRGAGGLGGLLIGLSASFLPGIGPVLTTGTLTATLGTTLAAAGFGTARGGLIGTLLGLGVPKEEAEVYAEGVKRGGVLVVVRADRARVAEAQEVMRAASSLDVRVLAREWKQSGWDHFDEKTMPDDDYWPL
jgi:hypothetical protein